MLIIGLVLSVFGIGFFCWLLFIAWGTGHPGGVGTLHAGSAIGALRRLEQLIQEAVVTVPRALIAETIDLIAVKTRRSRRATSPDRANHAAAQSVLVGHRPPISRTAADRA